MTPATATTALFLYGTLRAGEALSGLLPGSLARYEATIPGRLHYHPYGAYPVLLPAETAEDRVHGEIVWVNLDTADVAYVVLMELQAGYSATWASVALDCGGTVDALAFTWHPQDGAGARIEGDDWTMRHADHCRECGSTWPTTEEAEACEWTHEHEEYDRALSLALQKEDR